MVLQRAIEDRKEKLAVVFHILEFEVLHCDGLGAVFVGDDLQCAFLCNVTRLRLEGPEIAVKGNVYTREFGQIRCAEIPEAVLTIDDLTTQVTDDEETFAVSRHKEHRLHVKAKRTQSVERSDARQSDRAFGVADFLFSVSKV